MDNECHNEHDAIEKFNRSRSEIESEVSSLGEVKVLGLSLYDA
jgi:hypothetical protein